MSNKNCQEEEVIPWQQLVIITDSSENQYVNVITSSFWTEMVCYSFLV